VQMQLPFNVIFTILCKQKKTIDNISMLDYCKSEASGQKIV